MKDNTRTQVAAIDSFIRLHPWFDFQVASYQGNTLTISGSTDFIYYHELEVRFHSVFFASAYFSHWQSDTTNPVFRVLDGPEACELNSELEIEEGYDLFLFQVDDFRNAVIIAAESLSFSTDTVLHYYREDLPPGTRLADFVVKPE